MGRKSISWTLPITIWANTAYHGVFEGTIPQSMRTISDIRILEAVPRLSKGQVVEGILPAGPHSGL